MEVEKNKSKWTDWTYINICEWDDIGVAPDAMYKTNFKKVRVKLPTYNIVAESCCSSHDVFDLSFGVRIAYLRCAKKMWEKYGCDFESRIFEKKIQDMIDSLD